MNKFESKRFSLVVAAFVIVGGMGITSLFVGMEAIGVTCATGMCGLIGYYVNQETKRPSKKPDQKNEG